MMCLLPDLPIKHKGNIILQADNSRLLSVGYRKLCPDCARLLHQGKGLIKPMFLEYAAAACSFGWDHKFARESDREIVSLCRYARNETGIRVRQSLQRIIIVTSECNRHAVKMLQSLIKEEVNVHEIEFADDVSMFLLKKAIPKYRHLGPTFAADVEKIADLIRIFEVADIERLERGETVQLTYGVDDKCEIVSEDVEIQTIPKPGLAVQTNGNLTIALDTVLNESLIADGLSREFINRVQHMRKEAGFEVTDRINIYFKATPRMQKAVNLRDDYIQQEVLSVRLENNF